MFVYPVGRTPDNMFAGGIATPEYSPFKANVTALGTKSFDADRQRHGRHTWAEAMPDAIGIKRYWDVTETGDLTADISFTYR